MKALAAAVLALAALAALALGAALLLHRWVAGDAVRARIESTAETALGRALRYERLDFGLLPPSLVVFAPVIAGTAPDSPRWRRRAAFRCAWRCFRCSRASS